MKKLVMFLVVAMLSIVSVMAVEYKQADVPSWTDKVAYLAYWKSVTSPVTIMQAKLQEVSKWQVKAGEVEATVPAITALVDANASTFGVTDANVILGAKAYALRGGGGLCNESLALIGNNTTPLLLSEKAWNLYLLKRYAEAIPVFVAINQPLNAFKCAVAAKDNIKLFELAKSLTLNAYTTPVILTEVLDKLGEMNFEGSAVTKDMELAFLKALNEKYSRFLLKDKATWEPIIAGIRLTIEVKQGK